MFKKGQLVRTADGIYGVIEKESTVYRRSYIVRSLYISGSVSVLVCDINELQLIGNNFKFKGAK